MENRIRGQTSVDHDARADAHTDPMQFFYGNALGHLVQTRTAIFLRASHAEKMLCAQDAIELSRKSLFSFIFLDQRANFSFIDLPDSFLKCLLLLIQFKKHGHLALSIAFQPQFRHRTLDPGLQTLDTRPLCLYNLGAFSSFSLMSEV